MPKTLVQVVFLPNKQYIKSLVACLTDPNTPLQFMCMGLEVIGSSLFTAKTTLMVDQQTVDSQSMSSLLWTGSDTCAFVQPKITGLTI